MDRLGSVEVVTADGDRRALRYFWEHDDCLLIFLRHYGCPSCSETVLELIQRLLELRALGVRVVLIGAGSEAAAKDFSDRLKLEREGADVVNDPSLEAFRAAGFARSSWATYGPRAMLSYLRLLAMGHGGGPRNDGGDPIQQGGAIFVQRQSIIYSHKNRDLGDRASLVDVINLALTAAAERAQLVI